MKKLLIRENIILAGGEYQEREDSLIVSGMTFPKSIIDGFELLDIELPEDFSPELYTWNGTTLERKEIIVPVVVPQTVTMRQARLALLEAGKLAEVNIAINNLPSPQKEAAQIEWDYSSVVERTRPLVQTLGPLLGLSEKQLDDLFILAGTL